MVASSNEEGRMMRARIRIGSSRIVTIDDKGEKRSSSRMRTRTGRGFIDNEDEDTFNSKGKEDGDKKIANDKDDDGDEKGRQGWEQEPRTTVDDKDREG